MDGAVVAFACGLVFVTALLAGLLPAISSTGKAAFATLKLSSRGASGNVNRSALRKTLLTVEIAVTVVLLIAAGLLIKSFMRLRTTRVGAVTDNVLTLGYGLPAQKYDTLEKATAFHDTLLQRLRAMPGVRSAALGFVPARSRKNAVTMSSRSSSIRPSSGAKNCPKGSIAGPIQAISAHWRFLCSAGDSLLLRPRGDRADG